MNLALWSAKTGLDAQNTQMAIIANNLANANTTGYKSQRAAFQDLMYQNIRQVGAQSTQNTQYSTGLTLGTGVRIVATEKNYTQGSVTTTNGSAGHVAVNGRGFLQITMPDGTLAYTRDGSFTLDSQGNVVTASGYPLQPAITIPAGTQSVTIGNDGVVTAVSAGNKATQIGQIQLADFINEQGLQPTATTCHRVRGQRLAADRHSGRQRPRHRLSRAHWRPPTSTRSPSSST
jgi:flagellar basal-body rod protein FlgG